MMRFPSALALFVALNACAPAPASFHSNANGHADPLIDIGAAAGIQVDMVDGTPAPMARLLAQAVADSLGAYNIPAIAGTAKASRYVLKGRADLNETEPRLPYVVVINWTLLDRRGQTVGRHTQGVPGHRWQWDFGDPRIIWTVGKEAAKPIAAMVQDGAVVAVSHRPDAAAAAARADGIWIEPVRGAPGDGNAALARAMKAALEAHRLAIASARAEAALMLHGTVEVGAPERGRQGIKIVWRVVDPNGGELGRATQDNAIPAGSLDGAWGPIAAAVAEAAVGGIRDVVGRGRAATAAAPTNGTRTLGVPPRFDLPHIRGRALPPPT